MIPGRPHVTALVREQIVAVVDRVLDIEDMFVLDFPRHEGNVRLSLGVDLLRPTGRVGHKLTIREAEGVYPKKNRQTRSREEFPLESFIGLSLF